MILIPTYYKDVIARRWIDRPHADHYGVRRPMCQLMNPQSFALGEVPSSVVIDVHPRPHRRSFKNPIAFDAGARSRVGTGASKDETQVPNYVVNTGNASRVGDQADDAPQPDYPAGERMS